MRLVQNLQIESSFYCFLHRQMRRLRTKSNFSYQPIVASAVLHCTVYHEELWLITQITNNLLWKIVRNFMFWHEKAGRPVNNIERQESQRKYFSAPSIEPVVFLFVVSLEGALIEMSRKRARWFRGRHGGAFLSYSMQILNNEILLLVIKNPGSTCST